MPRVDIKKTNTTMNFVLSKELKEKIFTIATQENRSASNLVVSVLSDYVNLHKDKTQLIAYKQLVSEIIESDAE